MTDVAGAGGQPVQTCGQRGGVTVSGQPCQAMLGLGALTGLCTAHDPGRVQEMNAERKAVAELSREELAATFPQDMPPPPETIEDAKHYASWCVAAVARGPAAGGIDLKRGHVIAVLLRQFQSSAHESELAARIKTLETELREFKAKAKAAAKVGGGAVR